MIGGLHRQLIRYGTMKIGRPGGYGLTALGPGSLSGSVTQREMGTPGIQWALIEGAEFPRSIAE